MAVLGEIARKARERMPATWNALSERATFGDDGLQGRVDAVKSRLFGEVVEPDEEFLAYGSLGTDYAGVVVALELIAPAYDHWMTAATSWSASGRNENKTFVNRAEALLKFRDEILEPEERRLYPLVQELLVGVMEARRIGIALSRMPLPEDHSTPDPLEFERPFEAPRVVVV